MNTNLIEHSPAVVQAIHEVFHQSEPCHCEGPGKLSEDEVLEALVRLRYVALPDVPQQDLLPIEAMARSERIMWVMSGAKRRSETSSAMPGRADLASQNVRLVQPSGRCRMQV